MFDSTEGTLEHIARVREFLREIEYAFVCRGIDHDKSKLEEPEKSVYDEYTPKLRDTPYGSEEYWECLRGMGHALDHHYANNSHHPEHHLKMIDGMSLLDLLEMLADWKAAGLRHKDSSMAKSIEINQERFQMSEQLTNILKNTVREMGWE